MTFAYEIVWGWNHICLWNTEKQILGGDCFFNQMKIKPSFSSIMEVWCYPGGWGGTPVAWKMPVWITDWENLEGEGEWKMLLKTAVEVPLSKTLYMPTLLCSLHSRQTAPVELVKSNTNRHTQNTMCVAVWLRSRVLLIDLECSVTSAWNKGQQKIKERHWQKYLNITLLFFFPSMLHLSCSGPGRDRWLLS